MQPADYLTVLRRRWWVVVVACLLGVLIGYQTGRSGDRGPERFEATHTLSLLQPSLLPEDQQAPTLTASQVAVFATVGEVPQRAADSIGYDGRPQDLVGRVEVTGDDELRIISISATHADGQRAVEIADAFGEELVAQLQEDRQSDLQEDLQEAQAEVDSLQQRVSDLDLGLATGGIEPGVGTAERDALVNQYRIAYDRYQQLASSSDSADQIVSLEQATAQAADGGLRLPTSRPGRMAVFGMLGALLGVGLALLLDRLDTRVRSRHDVEDATGFPVIAEIPHLPRRHRGELVTVTRPSSPFAEAYRNLRTILVLTRLAAAPQAGNGHGHGNGSGHEPVVILVTSPGPSEGKTTTVSQLAAAYAETDRSVLLLDCDLRRPRLHRIFGTEEAPGLSDTLVEPSRFGSDSEVIRPTPVDGVRLVPAGTSFDNPAQLFRHAQGLIAASRRQADVVLVDTPPFLVANDAQELMPWVDAVVLVMQAKRTSVESAVRGGEQLRRLGAPTAGVVLAGAEAAESGYSSYYHYSARRRSRRGLIGRFRPRGRPAEPAANEEEQTVVDQAGVVSGPVETARDTNPSGAPRGDPRPASYWAQDPSRQRT